MQKLDIAKFDNIGVCFGGWEQRRMLLQNNALSSTWTTSVLFVAICTRW